ncbi:MAG: hypothetical protein N2578_03570 [Bdellovibrionaceae bacterium]|nr:hypothetical protein [Pseudobdellovibrionaceae bacterium]
MNNVGYGCLSNQSLYQVSFGGVYWFTLSPAPMQWVNIGQVSSTNVNVTHTGNGCTANVAAACYVGVANSCGPGLRCQPTAYGSPIGICVQ